MSQAESTASDLDLPASDEHDIQSSGSYLESLIEDTMTDI